MGPSTGVASSGPTGSALDAAAAPVGPGGRISPMPIASIRIVVPTASAAAGKIAVPTSFANNSTTAGSNCVPLWRSISSQAWSSGIALRYGRSVVWALSASATEMMRAPSGISLPSRRSG